MIIRAKRRLLFSALISSCLIILLSCSSTPIKTEYYVLESTPVLKAETQHEMNRPVTNHPVINRVTINHTVVNRTKKGHPLVIIKSIQLADFLKQDGLVMQINQHQLQPALHHLWAESLDEGIKKSLLQDLQSANLSYTVSADYRWLTEQPHYQIQVKIDQFYATDRSSVIMSGRYWIINTQTKKVVVDRQFNYQSKLDREGYEYAVSKLRILISQLGRQIGDSLKLINSPVAGK